MAATLKLRKASGKAADTEADETPKRFFLSPPRFTASPVNHTPPFRLFFFHPDPAHLPPASFVALRIVIVARAPTEMRRQSPLPLFFVVAALLALPGLANAQATSSKDAQCFLADDK